MQARLKESFERNRKALSLRPAIGRGTARTKVRLVEGLACEIEDGRWRLNVDLSAKSGGTGEAPDPGVLGRGALGSCLAIAYALWAAEAGLPIDSLSVEIEADYDARGMYGVDGVIADYPEIRYRVTLRSPASDEAIEAVLADAEKHCNYLNVFQRAHELKRELRIER